MRNINIKLSEVEAAAGRRPSGYMQDVLSAAIRTEGGMLVMSEHRYRELVAKYSPGVPASGGPGTELKALLGRIGIRSTPTCSCNAHAREMDHWGPDECERRLDEIVERLREQAASRRLPFSGILARQLVRLAIRRARSRVLATAKNAGK